MRAGTAIAAIGWAGMLAGCGGSAAAPSANAPANVPSVAIPAPMPMPAVARAPKIETPPEPATPADKTAVPALAFPEDEAATANKGPELPRR